MQNRYLLIVIVSILSVFVTVILLISPLLDGIAMGVALAYASKPIMRKFEKKLPLVFSAFLATLIIVLPLFFIFFYGLFQGLYQLLLIFSDFHNFFERVFTTLREFGVSEDYIQKLREYIPTLYSFISQKFSVSVVSLTAKFVMFLLNFFLSSIVCFYALLDGDRFVKKLLSALPEENRKVASEFFEEVDSIFTGLWFGNLVFAIIIALISLPFFVAFNIPYTPLLVGLMFLAAIIPIFAEWMVIAPVAIYLFTVDVYSAIYFTVIGVVFLYIIPELFIRPQFVGYASKIHPLVLLLSFIGGGLFGGIAGFFIAPMLAGIATAIYNHFTKI